MQDQDVPPVEEGETGGGVDVVRVEATPVADAPDAINNMAAVSTLRQWTIATERQWAGAITGPVLAANGQGFRRTILSRNRTHCQCARTPPLAYSALWMTCSSRRKFKKLRA